MKQEFSFLENKKKGEEKEGKNKRKNKKIKSEEKSWPKEDQDSHYHPQKEKLIISFKVTKLAPTVRTEFNAARRTYLEGVLNGLNPMSEVSTLFQLKGNGGRTSGPTFQMNKNFAGVKVVDDCGAVALTNEEVKTIAREIRRRSRSKLIQFWDNRRPPYWGTWGKTSHSVGPRRPFSKEKTLDYNADSDDEWEKKIKEIEVLTITDSEEEGEEPEPANNNNSKINTVPHAEFLTEMEMLRKEYERQKELQTMSLLASLQCVSEEQPNEDLNPKPQGEVLPQPSAVEGLSIGNKRTRDDSDDPGSARKRKPSKLNPANAHLFALSSKRVVCEESIPALIRFIHGSTCSKLKTVKKFQLYLARIIPEKNVPCQTRVLAKFGEIAALDKCTEAGPLNGKMCYFVHEDVLERYNLSDLSPIRHGNLGTGHRDEEEATLSRIEVTTPQSKMSRVLVQQKSGILQESFCRDF